jgi:phosphoribosylformylglycinamidine synthase
MGDGLVRSATTPGKGGWALAMARCVMASDLGMELDLGACPDLAGLPVDVALFSESNGRFLVTVTADDAPRFESGFEGLACRRVGEITSSGRLRVKLKAGVKLDADADSLRAAFKETLGDD